MLLIIFLSLNGFQKVNYEVLSLEFKSNIRLKLCDVQIMIVLS